MRMKNNQIWRYVFPALSVVLWIATIVLFFRGNRAYSTTDYEAQMQIASALRWQPACFVGALISTAAAYVASEIEQYLNENED